MNRIPTASEIAAIGAKVPAGRGYTERRDRAIWIAACDAMSAQPAEALHLTAMVKYFSERGMTAWADVIIALLRRVDSAVKT